MKAIDFVKTKYPKAFCYPMIDNKRRQTSYVIVTGNNFEFITNEGARTASKAWSDARKFLDKLDKN